MAACWSGFVLAAGCGIFSPDEDDIIIPPDEEYPILSSPNAVLNSLELAYGKRDSVKYKELYDSTYTGSSVDLNDASTTLISFDDEMAHIRALASTSGLSSYMSLGPELTWERLSSDDPSHPEWALILISGSAYQIEVTEGTNTLGAVGEAGTFQEFAFTPSLEPTSPSDTLWKIVRWRETGRSQSTP